MVVPGKEEVEAELADHVQDRGLVLDRFADSAATYWKREDGVMGDQDARDFGIDPAERLANERNLFVIDLAVLEGRGAGGVDPEHRRSRNFVKRAQDRVDEFAVARQRREEAAKYVVQRDIVIARNGQHHMTFVADPLDERAGLFELRSARALGEIARRHHQVRFFRVDASLDRRNQLVVMGSKMEVGDMRETGHCR